MDQISFEGCFGCGPDNEAGLQATFRNMSDGGVEGFFTPQQHHCGYRDVVHVGPIAGFLNELLGRLAFNRNQYYLTQSMSITFKCAVSPCTRLHGMSRLKHHSKAFFTAEAEIFGPEGELVAKGEGQFVTMERAQVKRVVGKGKA